MIVCVAVVGHQNNPLYLQSFTEADDALKLHHIVHCSLDVIDERVNNPKKTGPTLNETFLGLLYPTENYKVYGYLTNTKVKFIMVTTDLDVRDVDVRNLLVESYAYNDYEVQSITSNSLFNILEQCYKNHTGSGFKPSSLPVEPITFTTYQFFRRFHSAYVDAVSNPFHVPGKKITSTTFAQSVSAIVKSFGSSAAV